MTGLKIGCLIQLRPVGKEAAARLGFPRYSTSIFRCTICGREHTMPNSRARQRKHCCRECYAATRRGVRRGPTGDGRVKNGAYWYVYNPGHPAAVGNGKTYVAEHRLVAELKIGRLLAQDEVVHHINGDTTDNRPENLEVMTWSEHASLHARAKDRDENGSFVQS